MDDFSETYTDVFTAVLKTNSHGSPAVHVHRDARAFMLNPFDAREMYRLDAMLPSRTVPQGVTGSSKTMCVLPLALRAASSSGVNGLASSPTPTEPLRI